MQKKMNPVRVKLWDEAEGRCYWCNCLTVLGFGDEPPVPMNLATIDHVRSRLHPDGRSSEVVLACYGCNKDRADAEQQTLLPEEKYERSTRPPRRSRQDAVAARRKQKLSGGDHLGWSMTDPTYFGQKLRKAIEQSSTFHTEEERDVAKAE